jgi:transcriptional regulator
VGGSADKADLLQGMLDMLVLQALVRGSMHGYGVAKWIQSTTDDALSVEEGSLYPALYRMERRGWIMSTWGQSESNRRAKFYKLSRTGRAQLGKEVAAWEALVRAVSLILRTEPVGESA